MNQEDLLKQIRCKLRLLNFIRPDDDVTELISKLDNLIETNQLHPPLSPQLSVQLHPVQLHPVQLQKDIEEVEEHKMIKIGILRKAKGVSQSSENTLNFNKKDYRFDYVFSETEHVINSMVNFVKSRLRDTLIILYGYSGSGKTTLTCSLLKELGVTKFKLYEIYLGKMYVLENSRKVETNNIDDDKYIINSTNPENLLRSFSINRSTDTNAKSSRSHTFIKCYSDKVVTICDLCGNEKYSLFNSKESLYINKSLFEVTQWLRTKKKIKSILTEQMMGHSGVILNLLFHDNNNSKSSSHLSLFKDALN